MPRAKNNIESQLELGDEFTLSQNRPMPNVLSAQLMHAFTEEFLIPFYDDPQPIPDFHVDAWELWCSDHRQVGIAAPRFHGKTTALTVAGCLANVMFKCADFVIIGSNTLPQAEDILGVVALHIKHNKELKRIYPGIRLLTDNRKELIGTLDGVWYFRIMAKGWTQQFRGSVWGVKRPNLVLLDDFESPEDVDSKELRQRMYRKLMTDILLCGSSYCRYRIAGTVLHEDSLLENILKSPAWLTKRYRAHNADYTKVLFPGSNTPEKFMKLQEEYARTNSLDMYYRELHNSPTAIGDTLLVKAQFIEMSPEDYKKRKRFYVTIDFAISESDRADFTVFLVFGVDEEGIIHIVHVERFRMSPEQPLRIEETFFDINDSFIPEMFIAETEKIDKAIMPYLRLGMQRRAQEGVANPYFVVKQLPSSKSKIKRGTGMIARMQAGVVRFNKKAAWYPEFEHELLQATPAGVKSKHDDQWDTFTMIGTCLDKYIEALTDDEQANNEMLGYNAEIDEAIELDESSYTICDVTGY